MKKLLIVAAMAGGLMFAGFTGLANADHRGHGPQRGHYHGRYDSRWNRGRSHHHHHYRSNNWYGRPRSNVSFGFNFGGYPGYYSPGFYGPNYGYYGNDYCW